MATTAASRGAQRRARTREALIRAGQRLLADGRTDVAVSEITASADVGLGSFYNHFTTKDELFDASVAAAAETHTLMLREVVADLTDPVERFARSFRLIGRFHRHSPEISKAMIARAAGYYTGGGGLVERLREDLWEAQDSGRISVPDVEVTVAAITGAATMLGHLLHHDGQTDDAEATDALTTQLLLMLGLDRAEATELAQRPLPQLGSLESGEDS